MRYDGVDNIYFEDINGNSHMVKDMRELPEYRTLTNYAINENEDIDEIITRQVFLGRGQESLSFMIWEANKVQIMENNFNLSNIRSLIIPIMEF